MNIKYLKIILPALTGLGLVFASASNTAFAWQKDGSADCSRVFASIRNESQTMSWDGYVKAGNSIVVSDSGMAAPFEWKTINWTPPSGFEGNVEAVSRLKNSNGDVADYRRVRAELECPTASPTPSPSPSPSPSPLPSPSPSPEPEGGQGQDQEQGQEQKQKQETNVNVKVEQKQENNQTVNVTGQVAGVSTVPVKQPETGPGVLGMVSVAGAGPLGLLLARYGRGRIVGKKDEDLTSIASAIVTDRLDKKSS